MGFYDIVGIARDWSVILLVIEGIILCALPFFLLWKLTTWARRFLKRVRPALRSLQGSVQGITGGIDKALAAVRAPFVWIESAEASVRGFCRVWKRG